jgi:uncharacterized protein DUF6882
MSPEDFSEYRDRAVHGLMRLTEECKQRFRIGYWKQCDYDLDAGTLIFSEADSPRIVAQIQVVGTTSSRTWLWGWANEDFPKAVTERLREVRQFGEDQALSQLTEPQLVGDEYLGWELTAITAQILGASGAYCCPGEHGDLYLVYTDVSFAA